MYDPWYSFVMGIWIIKWIDMFVRSTVKVHFDGAGMEPDGTRWDRVRYLFFSITRNSSVCCIVASSAKFSVSLRIQWPQSLLIEFSWVKQLYEAWLHTHNGRQDAVPLIGEGNNVERTASNKDLGTTELLHRKETKWESNIKPHGTNLRIPYTCHCQINPIKSSNRNPCWTLEISFRDYTRVQQTGPRL